MKKKMIALLPLCMLLASCNLVLTPSATSDATTSSTEKTTTETQTTTTTTITTTTTPTTTTPTTTTIIEPTTTITAISTTTVTPVTTTTTATEEEVSFQSADFSTPIIEVQDEATYEDLFNLGNKISVSIEMEDSELEKLEADYETNLKSEIYRHCKSVTITMVNYDQTFTWTFEDVGIRQKGNTSRETIYQDGEIANLNHFKLSFDETFDDTEAYGSDAYDWTGREAEYQERCDRNFLGLSGLDLKWNRNDDTTHIREIYASKLYQSCGIMSQYIGLSTFGITTSNKTYNMGLYTIYEPATKSMIKRHLKDSDIFNFGTWKEEKNGEYGYEGSNYGDLYKLSYGVGDGSVGGGADLSSDSMSGSRIGESNLSGSYIPAYDLKTNSGLTSNTYLKALGTAVSSGSYAKINSAMDLQYFALTEACNWFIGNPDDLRNNNNNSMIYIRKTDGKAVIIPIDNDRCFGITEGWNPDGNGMMYRGIYETERACGNTSNKLYTTTILSSSSNAAKSYYLEYLKLLASSDWAKTSTFDALYNIASATYADSWESDFHGVGFSLTDDTYNIPFATYVSNKLKLIPSGGGSSSDTTTTTTSSEDDTTTTISYQSGNYGDVYLVGSNNGWNGKTCPMEFKGYGEYTITFSPNVSGSMQFKFNNGEDWNHINWGMKDDALSLSSGDNFVIDGLTTSSVVTITINTLDLTIAWEIN